MFGNPADDKELIGRLQSGDLDALGELYDRYRHQIYRTALAITHDPAAAEDILQECFLRVHRYAHRIDANLPIAPWLYRVTVNLSYTWAKQKPGKNLSIEVFIEQLISPSGHAPDTTVERVELSEKIEQAIDALPFGQKVVVVLYYLNGMNLKEIAEILDCPVGTVKSRLFHARESLRERIEESESWLSDIAHGYT
jgi:RNA polymerase sigma-70 factor (ECF subfamily)